MGCMCSKSVEKTSTTDLSPPVPVASVSSLTVHSFSPLSYEENSSCSAEQQQQHFSPCTRSVSSHCVEENRKEEIYSVYDDHHRLSACQYRPNSLNAISQSHMVSTDIKSHSSLPVSNTSSLGNFTSIPICWNFNKTQVSTASTSGFVSINIAVSDQTENSGVFPPTLRTSSTSFSSYLSGLTNSCQCKTPHCLALDQSLLWNYEQCLNSSANRSCKKESREFVETSSSLLDDSWEIDHQTVQIGNHIGCGQFGEVYKGWMNGHCVAVKTMKSNNPSTSDFLNEANILKQLHHAHIVRLLAVCTQHEPIWIITEFMADGNLLRYLRADKSFTLTSQFLLEVLIQVACGMAYLEKRRMVHRDVAARNILIHHKTCKVSDFGLARILPETADCYVANDTQKIPMKWTAPEAILNKLYTCKSDVWSFAVCQFETMSRGQEPYAGMSSNEVIERIKQGYRLPCPTGCCASVYGIMLNSWNLDPFLRPTFQDIHATLEKVLQKGVF